MVVVLLSVVFFWEILLLLNSGGAFLLVLFDERVEEGFDIFKFEGRGDEVGAIASLRRAEGEGVPLGDPDLAIDLYYPGAWYFFELMFDLVEVVVDIREPRAIVDILQISSQLFLLEEHLRQEGIAQISSTRLRFIHVLNDQWLVGAVVSVDGISR